jgi:hypothetical protein
MQQPTLDRYYSPPRGYGGAVQRQPQPQASNWAGQSAPLIVGLGLEAMQGMINAMNAIAYQVIRNSGRSTQNVGWLYFDGTFRDYPAFKRKFAFFRANYHRGTPTRELFQQFRELCLPEKIAAKLKTAETMETSWVRLDAWFGDRSLFIEDLMQDIKNVTPIKDGDNERLMDYYLYVMLQSHIAEARNAGLLGMLLIPANLEMMKLPLILPGRKESGEMLKVDYPPRTEHGSWRSSWKTGWGMPPTWWPRARGTCCPSQSLCIDLRDHCPRRAEEAATAAEIPQAGTRGS